MAQDAAACGRIGIAMATCSHQSVTQPWARLISIKGTNHPNIDICDDRVILGEIDAKGENSIREAQCRIERDAYSGDVTITNLSVNGIVVKGRLLAMKNRFTIQSGDEIVFGPHISGYHIYRFQILDRHPDCSKKRSYEVLDTDVNPMDMNAGRDSSNMSSATSLSEKKLKVTENMENITCGICLNVLHDVVTVMPCLHSYCNGCLSNWYKTLKNQACTCPKCRRIVHSVGRNHMLNGLVEEIVKMNMSLGRSKEDIAELDKVAVFKSDYMKITHDEGCDYSSSYGDDDSDEDTEQDQCPQCPRQNPLQEDGGFQCGPDTRHIICSLCSKLMPERPSLNIPQKCGGCGQNFCDAYWRSQNLPRNISCCTNPGSLKSICERNVLEIPRGTFKGNVYEQEVTKMYMNEQGLVIQDVLREWFNKLDAGEVEQPKLPNTHSPVTSATFVCDHCADITIQHLLYKFRLSVPKHELPPNAAGREDCWYGHFCRTQHHKLSHAQRLNHVCEPTRPAREN